MFTIFKQAKSGARSGYLQLGSATVPTPLFMPVATQGAVKHISSDELGVLNFGLRLSNTYHLMLRPGAAAIKQAGGLAAWSGWPGATLTDSGGFQIFSLSGVKGGPSLVKMTEEKVIFKSYLDGSRHELSPEGAVKLQVDLGTDIAVCLDECPALPADRDKIKAAVELTGRWAERSKIYHQKITGRQPRLFAVIQGGLDKKLRLASLRQLVDLDFDGYNIGGLSVGEKPVEMYKVLSYLVPLMPADKPRYLMGVGYPEDIARAVRLGVDMFDCVIPTREGRHGRLLVWPQNGRTLLKNFWSGHSRRLFYQTVNVNNANTAKINQPLDPVAALPELRNATWAYLHHLFKVGEPLGQRLASLHNLAFYARLMEELRRLI